MAIVDRHGLAAIGRDRDVKLKKLAGRGAPGTSRRFPGGDDDSLRDEPEATRKRRCAMMPSPRSTASRASMPPSTPTRCPWATGRPTKQSPVFNPGGQLLPDFALLLHQSLPFVIRRDRRFGRLLADGRFAVAGPARHHLRRSVRGRNEPNITALANVIPEPGTYALLAAGLGLVGLAVRRRRDEVMV